MKRLKNIKLRIVWIIPNVFCYLMVVGFSTFVVLNAEGLQEISRLGIWVFAMLVLFFVSLLGSFRIWTWIKEGSSPNSGVDFPKRLFIALVGYRMSALKPRDTCLYHCHYCGMGGPPIKALLSS